MQVFAIQGAIINPANKSQFKKYSSWQNQMYFKGAAEVNAAKKLVNKHSCISGFLGFALAQVVGGDGLAHIANNTWMIKNIAKNVYKSQIDKQELNKCIRNATAIAFPIKSATGVSGIIPVVGNAVNGISCAAITKMVGTKFIEHCEKIAPNIEAKLATA